MPQIWESSWEEFFDLYHQAVSACVCGVFRKYNWTAVSESHIEDVALKVFESIFRPGAAPGFDPTRGKFRSFLSTVCQRRVIDFIRAHRGDANHVSLDGEDGFLEGSIIGSKQESFGEGVEETFRNALLGTLLSALRSNVSPQVYLIFELVKLAGEEPENVAEQMGVRRGVVDNSVYKAMQKLRELAQSPEIREEFDL